MDWRIVIQFGQQAEETGWGVWHYIGLVLGLISGYMFVAKLCLEIWPDKERWPDGDRGLAFLWPFIMFYCIPAFLAVQLVKPFRKTNLPKAKVIK